MNKLNKDMLRHINKQALTAWLIYFWLSDEWKRDSAYLRWECKDSPIFKHLDDVWKYILISFYFAETWEERWIMMGV